MNQIATLILGSILLVGTIACSDNAKTSTNAPNAPDQTGATPTAQTAQATQDDAASKTRRDQLNSDIRASEQRNDVTGGDGDRANGELASEVRSKLEANIPNGNLAVAAKSGAIIVSGTVQTQNQLDKIEPLTKQIKGVKNVRITAKVAPATPDKK